MTVRRLLAVLAGMALPLLLPTVALAHTGLQPDAGPAGEPIEFQFVVGHGCDGSPTTEIAVQIPPGFQVTEVPEPEGWQVEVSGDPISEIVWTGGSLPDGEPGDFRFTAVVTGEDGTVLVVPVYQACENGEEYRWIDEDPDSDTPAPTFTIGGEPSDHDHGDDHGDDHGHDHDHGDDDDHASEDGATDEPTPSTPSAEPSPEETATVDEPTEPTDAPTTEDVAAAPTEEPSPTAEPTATDPATTDAGEDELTTETSGGVGAAPWIIGAAVVLLGAIGAFVWRRRQS